MQKTNILICDEDASYALALVRFLVGQKRGFQVTYDTDLASFEKDAGKYQIGLMTAPFIRQMQQEPRGKHKVGNIIQLCGTEETGIEGQECLYKFQAMDEFMDSLLKHEWETPGASRRESGRTFFTGIISPSHHELELPFSLLYARICEETGKTIFLDLEENSILDQLIHRKSESSILDCIYRAETAGKNFRISEYADSYTGFSYIGPAGSPSELSCIEEKQWLRLFDAIRQEHYANAVILFGMYPQGFDLFLPTFDNILLLEKPGDYYKLGRNSFLRYLDRRKEELPVREIMLPMSAGNLSATDYGMEELSRGNLGLFMRRTFSGKTAAHG